MTPVIHIKQVIAELERKDDSGKAIPFSARVLKKDGAVALFEDAVCTSTYHNGTANIYTPVSQETRKVRMLHFIEFNGKEVVI